MQSSGEAFVSWAPVPTWDPRDAEVNPAIPWKVQGMSAQQTLEKEKGWEWGNFAFSFASAFFFLTMPMYHIYKKHECFWYECKYKSETRMIKLERKQYMSLKYLATSWGRSHVKASDSRYCLGCQVKWLAIYWVITESRDTDLGRKQGKRRLPGPGELSPKRRWSQSCE